MKKSKCIFYVLAGSKPKCTNEKIDNQIKFKTQIQVLMHSDAHIQKKKIGTTNTHKRDKDNSKLRNVFTTVIVSESFNSSLVRLGHSYVIFM